MNPVNKIAARRTLRSFLVLIAFFAMVVTSWSLARRTPDADGTPRAFRTVLEWNGAIWRNVFNDGSKAPGHSVPAPGRRPRVNGMVGLKSEVDPSSWRMTVDSNDEDPESESIEISLAEIRALPRVDVASELRCIEGWSDPIAYAGVRFSDFLKYYHLGARTTKDWDVASPPKDLFRYVGLETPDGEYYVSIDMESMLHSRTVLAYELNGRPLDVANGAPLRLIIPVKYGIKNLKRIGRIFFSNTRPPDYWQERGYDWFAGL